jgi:hypothetical protein
MAVQAAPTRHAAHQVGRVQRAHRKSTERERLITDNSKNEGDFLIRVHPRLNSSECDTRGRLVALRVLG